MICDSTSLSHVLHKCQHLSQASIMGIIQWFKRTYCQQSISFSLVKQHVLNLSRPDPPPISRCNYFNNPVTYPPPGLISKPLGGGIWGKKKFLYVLGFHIIRLVVRFASSRPSVSMSPDVKKVTAFGLGGGDLGKSADLWARGSSLVGILVCDSVDTLSYPLLLTLSSISSFSLLMPFKKNWIHIEISCHHNQFVLNNLNINLTLKFM